MRRAKSKAIPIKVGSAVVMIYPTPTAGYNAWTVVYYENEKRMRRKFSSLPKAKALAEDVAGQIARGDAALPRLDAASFAAYRRATKLLRPTRKPLEVAVAQYAEAHQILSVTPGAPALGELARDYVRRNPATLPRRTIPEVVDELVEMRRQDGCGPRHITDLASRLKIFASAFSVPITSLSGHDIDEWLRGLKTKGGKPVSHRTRNNFRGVIHNLFTFSKLRGYLPESWQEMNRVSVAKEPSRDVDIFTPEEMRLWLACAPAKLIPFLALGGFAGLRTSEIERMHWRDIDLESGWIKVPAPSKTGRRLVPIADNLAAWLAQHAGSGKVHVYANTANALTRLVKAVKNGGHEGDWKQNALRHSYVSYRLAATANAARVSEECGHTVRVLRDSYRELVTPKEAQAWFGISPDREFKIIRAKF